MLRTIVFCASFFLYTDKDDSVEDFVESHSNEFQAKFCFGT